jgi:hypothetical protein
MAFPASPTVGQQQTESGRLYQWTGYAWEFVASIPGHSATHAVGGGDAITLAASQLSGGSLPTNAKLVFSDGTNDSEVGGWGFGVELSSDTSKNAFIEYNSITVQTAGGSMQMTATGIGFPDATTQTTAFTGKLAASAVTGLATVATSGSYADLSNKPTIPNAYTLPTATASVLGGVKAGSNVTVGSDGTLSVAAPATTDASQLTSGSLSQSRLDFVPIHPFLLMGG